MSWQMLVLVAQLGMGGGLVLGGLRRAAHYWLAYRNKDHAEYIAKRLGEPPVASMGPAMKGILMALVGAVMLLTVDMTAEMLAPPQPY
jgi:hypothetical protein